MDRSPKRVSWLAAAALAAALPAAAETVEVTITSAGEHSYELTVGDVRKQGRIGAGAGASTVRDSVEIGSVPEVMAGLVFSDESGRSCACPPVKVALEAARSSCVASFERPAEPRPESCSCRSSCRARGAPGAREPDPPDDEDGETAIARQLLSNPFTRALCSRRARRSYTRRPRNLE